MADCIFCKIVKGDIPASKLYEDENFLVFLDIMPLNKGHALVIPKEHHETFVDLPEKYYEDMMKVMKNVYQALSSAIAADGFNIFCNNKKAAGQLVPHLHFHIAPRFKDDGDKIIWKQGKYLDGELEEIQKKVKKFL